MNISCPNCFAAYRVPETLARAGTKLRCAACAREWVPEVPADPMPEPMRPPEPGTMMEPVEEQAAAPAKQREDTPLLAPNTSDIVQSGTARILLGPTAPPALQQRGLPHAGALVRRRRPGNLLPMAWAASLFLVIVAAAGVLIYSAQIATAWPPFARVSGLLGS